MYIKIETKLYSFKQKMSKHSDKESLMKAKQLLRIILMEKSKISFSERIHFIGIGGIGMSGLAEVMKDMGFNVQGAILLTTKILKDAEKMELKFF